MQNVYDQILDVAENFIQTKGYNAFSYRDISAIVGVKTSSIHYHFPTKADLGKVVVAKHLESLMQILDSILCNTRHTSIKKLEQFIDTIINSTYNAGNKMCLGGMLASDVLTLPESIQYEVRVFFNRLEKWVVLLLTQAVETHEFNIDKKNIKNEAVRIICLLEGALLLARLFNSDSNLIIVKKYILEPLTRS